MTTKNEAKWAVLKLLSDGVWRTAREIAGELGLATVCHASQLLHNYHRQRLVRSRRANRRWRMYRISDKGLERLKWLD